MKTTEKERVIKWPDWVMLLRHDVSEYNVLKEKRMKTDVYRRFLREWNKDPESEDTRNAAYMVFRTLPFGVGDAETNLADIEGRRACEVGKKLSEGETPDVIFMSPYKRTLETLKHLTRGWPALAKVKRYEEEQIREQDHGFANLYNDWRIFHALHPEQRMLFKLLGPYWYEYPQEENVPKMRERNRSWMNTLTRDFAGKKVLAIAA